MADRQGKAMRVFAGTMLMVALVMIAFAIILRYAGSWGVPYFSFSSDRGSPCENNLTGYTCTNLTLADLEWYGDVDLPRDTRPIESVYVATHDYTLDARLEIPKASAAAGLKTLNASFGNCRADHPSPLDASGLTKICVMANDIVATSDTTPASRLYTVGSGLRKDGVLVVAMSIKSR